MSDSYVEVTHTSWFTRIRRGIGGIGTGFLLVIAAIAVLFWNEGRAVTTQRALEEGAGLVVTVDASRLDPQYDGKLVHFSADLKPEGRAVDGLFTTVVAPAGALRLVRTVEMYQWQQTSRSETRKKLGGGEEKVTTYSYNKAWSDRPIESASFKQPSGHQNPPMPLQSETFPVKSARAGAITLDGTAVSSLGKAEPLALTPADGRMVRDKLGTGRPVHVQGGTMLVGAEPTAPAIGDLRISFASATVDRVSAVGEQKDGKLVAYTTTNGSRLFMLRAGDETAAAMFDSAQKSNTALTWALRIGGLLAMLAGFRLLFSIVGVLGDVVPFIGDVFRFATGMVAFALTALIGPLVIGLAWLYYRPVLALIIIAAGVAIAVGFIMLGKARARSRQQAAAA